MGFPGLTSRTAVNTQDGPREDLGDDSLPEQKGGGHSCHRPGPHAIWVLSRPCCTLDMVQNREAFSGFAYEMLLDKERFFGHVILLVIHD